MEWATQLLTPPAGGSTLILTSTAFKRPVSVVEYAFVVWPGPMINEYVATAVKLTTAYPPLAVAARGPLSRLVQARFDENATATGHEEFDRCFQIKTRNPELVSTLISPTLIAEHLAGRVPDWSIAGHALVTQQYGSIKDPAEVSNRAARLMRVAELLDR